MVYVSRIVYGFHLPMWSGNPNIKNMLDEYSNIIKYDRTLSIFERGYVFVYFISSYKSLPITNNYIHEIDETIPPMELDDVEKDIISKFRTICDARLLWVKHADNI